jgi:alpha-D-ribose 1-methylphosphonate 5-triphosphate diphosphatase PhnM
MKHLKLFEDYTQDDDMMSDEEVKEEILEKIKHLKQTTNSWATRDTLRRFTNWGFWSGQVMASLDIETANKVAEELYNYALEFEPGHPNLEEIYDAL